MIAEFSLLFSSPRQAVQAIPHAFPVRLLSTSGAFTALFCCAFTALFFALLQRFALRFRSASLRAFAALPFALSQRFFFALSQRFPWRFRSAQCCAVAAPAERFRSAAGNLAVLVGAITARCDEELDVAICRNLPGLKRHSLVLPQSRGVLEGRLLLSTCAHTKTHNISHVMMSSCLLCGVCYGSWSLLFSASIFLCL